MHGAVVVHLDREEERRLAFRDLFQQLPVAGVALGERRQVIGELQQELEPLLAGQRGEVVGDLRQARVERARGHGVPPRLIGTRTVARLGPGAVVVADVREAEQVLQDEPGVAGPLADPQ